MTLILLSSKSVARKLYNKGVSVYILPCKMRVDNKWNKPLCLPKYLDFDKIIDEYEYYNCNNEVGTYCKYFKESEEEI